MLVAQHGSLEACPPVIEGLIVDKETMSMNEELRKRLRYLAHLPLSSQFMIMEIALEEPLVHAEVIDQFRG